jgi:D-alanyl-D-alanine carboxypeptidase/D-alanyl-D-alanine-endopeptidase (penicillin-binding protein 4)
VRRPRPEIAARVALLAVLVVLAAVAGYAGTAFARAELRSPTPAPRTPAAYRAVQASPPAPAPGTPGREPVPTALTRALAPVLTAPALGSGVHAQVLDAATGAVLYDRGSAAAGAPASTAKLLTAAAVLAVHRPTDRITTRVVAGSGGAIVLVGGGDPTLTGAPAGKPGAYEHAARISDLAGQLRRAGVRPTAIVVYDALFSGPAVSPAWAADDVPSEYASAITPVLADGGRPSPSATIRSATPDLAAGHELAAALGQPGLPVSRGTAPAGARELASVASAPIGVLVEQMLQTSDNVIAECLARQVALATHRPASFTGAAAAVRDVLRGLGVDPGAGMRDGSGLAASDRLSAATLAGVLRLATVRPGLRDVLAGMPVAAWSGTLAHRYGTGTARRAAGVTRAKTGTLTGVSTLAGLVHDRSGRLLVFAFLADAVPDTATAEPALDTVVGTLATCGCT